MTTEEAKQFLSNQLRYEVIDISGSFRILWKKNKESHVFTAEAYITPQGFSQCSISICDTGPDPGTVFLKGSEVQSFVTLGVFQKSGLGNSTFSFQEVTEGKKLLAELSKVCGDNEYIAIFSGGRVSLFRDGEEHVTPKKLDLFCKHLDKEALFKPEELKFLSSHLTLLSEIEDSCQVSRGTCESNSYLVIDSQGNIGLHFDGEEMYAPKTLSLLLSEIWKDYPPFINTLSERLQIYR